MHIIYVALLIVALIAICIKAYKLHGELVSLKERYSGISDVEIERANIANDIDNLRSDFARESRVYQEKKQQLTSKYDEAYSKYEYLLRNINFLEESLEFIDFGIYKPHFNFTDSEQYKSKIEQLREIEKRLIKNEHAVVCRIEWAVGGSKAEGRKMTRQTHKLMLRAFNGECDAALAKVRWDNILKMEERLRKAVESINKSAEVNQSYITEEYLQLKIEELRMAYEMQEKIKHERDEQKRIQDEMREEEKARREIERAKYDAEKEEQRFQKALERAREEFQKAKGDKIDELNNKISQLEADLERAREQKERAISQAQLTKSGHVYVISNIGSFGENVYKIGMTRRLDPMDRVKELGDASVPFEFDVHAMVYSDNAPELERRLQAEFSEKRVNLINPRKEFFYVSLNEIEEWSKKENYQIEFTKVAEARAFRESKSIRDNGNALKVGAELEEKHFIEEKLFDDEDNE